MTHAAPKQVKATAMITFSWRYDKMYGFKAGEEYTIPEGLYLQAKQYFKLAKEKINGDTSGQ